MPQLPFPIDSGVSLDDGETPVITVDDVAAVWDEQIQASVGAPVRDAIQAGQTALMVAYQKASSYAAAQSDPLRATGEYLDEIGNERDIHRQDGEQDTSYSPRVNAQPAVVDPNDIIDAVNAILAPFTDIKARYSERSDAWFLNNGTASWSSHVFGGDSNRAPNYPDRLYDDATPATLESIPYRRPGGARIFSDCYGRYFEIRIPDLAPIDQSVAAVFTGSQDPVEVGGFFVGDGTETVTMTFVWSTPDTEYAIYDQIISTVESLRGQGIRWTLLVDPRLTA